MYENLWYNAYITVSDWHAFGLSLDKIKECAKWADWSYEFWCEIDYWCVLFYGKAIFE